MKKEKIEKRTGGEIRAEGNTVQGYAVVFDCSSNDLGGFTEIIERGALDGVIEKSDVLACINHDTRKGVLARSKYGKGSLRLSIDEIGLMYSFDIADTSVGNELRSYLERGEIDGSSFAFIVGTDKWEKKTGGGYVRRIQTIAELFDVSAVFSPAYGDTTVALRSLSSIKDEEGKELKEAEDREALELADYYDNLRKEIL